MLRIADQDSEAVTGLTFTLVEFETIILVQNSYHRETVALTLAAFAIWNTHRSLTMGRAHFLTFLVFGDAEEQALSPELLPTKQRSRRIRVGCYPFTCLTFLIFDASFFHAVPGRDSALALGAVGHTRNTRWTKLTFEGGLSTGTTFKNLPNHHLSDQK